MKLNGDRKVSKYIPVHRSVTGMPENGSAICSELSVETLNLNNMVLWGNNKETRKPR